MKKSVLATIIVAVIIALGIFGFFIYKSSSGNSINKVFVNGKQVSTSIKPVMTNDTMLLPNSIWETLGISINWDKKNKTLNIKTSSTPPPTAQPTPTPSSSLTDRRIQLLEGFIKPLTPEEVADTWAKGVKARNGAVQYALMSTDLKRKELSSFEAANWVTGTSSPWIESYDMLDKKKVSDDEYEFTVRFNKKLSNDPLTYTTTNKITVHRYSDSQTGAIEWLIRQIAQI